MVPFTHQNRPEDKKALEGEHRAKGWSERMRLSGSYFASRAKAIIAAAMGAEADVPVWLSVHRCLRSVVICGKRSEESQRQQRETGAGWWINVKDDKREDEESESHKQTMKETMRRALQRWRKGINNDSTGKTRGRKRREEIEVMRISRI